MFFKFINHTDTKNDIRDALLSISAKNGEALSVSRADRLAVKFKRRENDPMLTRFIQYSDITGEEATRRADKALGLAA